MSLADHFLVLIEFPRRCGIPGLMVVLAGSTMAIAGAGVFGLLIPALIGSWLVWAIATNGHIPADFPISRGDQKDSEEEDTDATWAEGLGLRG